MGCSVPRCPDPANDLRGDADLYDYCVDDPVSKADWNGLAWGETKYSRYKYGKIETDGSMLEAIGTMKLAPALGAAYVADRVEEMRGKEARHYNNVKEKVVKPHAKMLGAVTTGQALAPLTAASAPAIASGTNIAAQGVKTAMNKTYNDAGMQFASKFPKATQNMADFVAGYGNGIPSIPPASIPGLAGSFASVADIPNKIYKKAQKFIKERMLE